MTLLGKITGQKVFLVSLIVGLVFILVRDDFQVPKIYVCYLKLIFPILLKQICHYLQFIYIKNLKQQTQKH